MTCELGDQKVPEAKLIELIGKCLSWYTVGNIYIGGWA